ncbi:MAG TPA: hypothetical protein VJ909_04055 [Prolixibacteraceae bacterium]|nr:hypothetical protein [Prolixibacteraceae bacterium]
MLSNLVFGKHLFNFVIDGYDATDSDFFWFNFGHGGQTYNNSRHYLNDITPAGTGFDWTENQMAIVGISPTNIELCPDEVDIFDVPYTSVLNLKNEEAQNNIILPADGKELAIGNGGKLTLTAGNSIILKSGFHNAGGEFIAHINTGFTEEMDINVSLWPEGFSPNGDGINDELCISVENANSWEFTAKTASNEIVFQSAGTITGDNVSLWDGTGAHCLESHFCTIRLKNNYGRTLEKLINVYVACGLKSLYNSNDNLTLNITDTDMRSYDDGLYVVCVEIKDRKLTQKILLEK